MGVKCMFKELIDYDNALDIIKEYDLDTIKINTLLQILRENPSITVPKLIEITGQLHNDERIILGSGVYPIHPILNESKKTISLLEIVIPSLLKHIPKQIIGYLTEKQTKIIVDKILNTPIDANTTLDGLKIKLDEMFTTSEINIPVQGFRQHPESSLVVVRGLISPQLHKGIQFDKNNYISYDKSRCNNNYILKNVLSDYSVDSTDTPIGQILPKFILVLKKLLED